MLTITDEQVVYSLSPNNAPVAEAEPGETVIFYTKDCFSNQIQTEADLFEAVGWATINPATGPLAIKGARPGDTLVVYIEDIEIADQGCMVTVPGMGAAGDLIEKSETKIVPIKNGKAVFNEKISIPIRPMIGVIGTAPANDDIPCGTPGKHGGNMDTKLIGKGTTLYLPVWVEGALLAMGDLHAVMGDGEVSVTGVEIPGKVTVKVDLIKNKSEEWPVLETEESFYVIASAEDLDEASDFALKGMIQFLCKRTDMNMHEIVSLLSAVGNMEICQVVDPLKTVRMGISKNIMQNYNLKF
ncbi:acetamidase/formamidase family protein [Thermosyntropha sp.]|uniref:acetamidase/formamidase family protein n=1 Tax=Thermosyntropha sp. TaxID=2740820 RepID=UPI0025E0AFC1|nr:acetamidase/formamidase family protein [Thermosyntropha sp.]MBO8158959.1 acetamidase/formamidase family protein [Thermosyntropha sp.]